MCHITSLRNISVLLSHIFRVCYCRVRAAGCQTSALYERVRRSDCGCISVCFSVRVGISGSLRWICSIPGCRVVDSSSLVIDNPCVGIVSAVSAVVIGIIIGIAASRIISGIVSRCFSRVRDHPLISIMGHRNIISADVFCFPDGPYVILLQIRPHISPALILAYRHSITIGFAVTVQLKLYRLWTPRISGILPHLVRRDGNFFLDRGLWLLCYLFIRDRIGRNRLIIRSLRADRSFISFRNVDLIHRPFCGRVKICPCKLPIVIRGERHCLVRNQIFVKLDIYNGRTFRTVLILPDLPNRHVFRCRHIGGFQPVCDDPFIIFHIGGSDLIFLRNFDLRNFPFRIFIEISPCVGPDTIGIGAYLHRISLRFQIRSRFLIELEFDRLRTELAFIV